eukprot:893318-Rhodomonas_salina.2
MIESVVAAEARLALTQTWRLGAAWAVTGTATPTRRTAAPSEDQAGNPLACGLALIDVAPRVIIIAAPSS